MTRIEKIASWSTFKEFEANSLEEAIEMAKSDEGEDWRYLEDDSATYYLGSSNE